MSNIIDHLLAEVCLDERIHDGIFDMSNNLHMEALRESMTDTFGVALNDVKDIHNKMLEGKYPERQAYNKDGLLVTFPTPQHKAKAIQRGTHFEQDPSKGASNVFGGGNAPQQGQQPPAGGQPPAAPAGGAPAAPEQPAPNVFDKEPAGGAPAAPAQPAPQSPQPPAGGQSSPSALPASDSPPPAPSAPSGGGGGTSLPPSGAPPAPPASGTPQPVPPASVPLGGQNAPPPNFDTPKSPEVRAKEAQVVKQMMAGDPNNPTLSPTMPVNVTEQLINVYNFAKQMGYDSAMKVIAESMNKK